MESIIYVIIANDDTKLVDTEWENIDETCAELIGLGYSADDIWIETWRKSKGEYQHGYYNSFSYADHLEELESEE